MIKVIGAILLIAASAYAGAVAAGGLKKRVKLLEALQIMLADIERNMRYGAMPTPQMVEVLTALPALSELEFIIIWHEQLLQGKSPHESLKAALQKNFPSGLKEQDISPLLIFVQTLGNTDVDGQLPAIELCKASLVDILTEACETLKTKGKVYRAIGALTGLTAAILLI